MSWHIRSPDMDPKAIEDVYDCYPDLFTIILHHGGYLMRQETELVYNRGQTTYIDSFDCDHFRLMQLKEVMRALGYDPQKSVLFRYLKPNTKLDIGLQLLDNEEDSINMLSYMEMEVPIREFNVYAEHENTTGKRLLIEQIDDDGLLEGGNEGSDDGVLEGGNECSDDSEDSDYFEDEDNNIGDDNVDMRDFSFHIDKDSEFMGNGSKVFSNDDVENEEDYELEELNDDGFESYDSATDEEGMRKKKIRGIRQHVESNAEIGNTFFYLGQKFESKTEVKDAVISHAIETRRKLVFVKNDKRRIRIRCEGVVTKAVPGNGGSQNCNIDGGSQNSNIDGGSNKCGVGPSRVKTCGKKGKLGGKSKDKKVKGKTNKGDKGESFGKEKREWVKRKLNIKCDWVLLASKAENANEWEVKTYKPIHICKQTRVLPFCTYKFLSSKVLPQLATNPKIPVKAVHANLETDLELQISEYKAYRALKAASRIMQGDYQAQYGEIRDYILELQRSNPDTTVKLDVEPGNLKSKTRVFKRIYICLGALKNGFKEIGRDLLGLDGCFMKEPAKGCILSAVGVDSNNDIYPVAYAIVEQECGASWKWFLDCLGEDVGLGTNSNFTFISDRQKGLIQAVETLFPCAEHRHCIRHIHGNMKSQYRGVAYKNHLWRCATVTTIPEFEKAMKELKEFDKAAYEYLALIPAHQWARSRFTGRAVSDVLLSNMCEVFNRWLVDARDKPIVTALEYIREYCMKRIVNVIKKKEKCDGPLSIGATKVFEKIKSEANKCHVLWGGNQKYQVTGPAINGQQQEQCVVDMETRTCACRKWELTGIPCKHAVAVNWNMAENGLEPGDPETWVHSVHLLTTWNNTYRFTIEPLNGRNLWPKAEDLYTLIPPKKISTPGRPKKKRRMSANEVDEIGAGGKLSTQGKLKKCGSCGQYGHNKRGCPNGASISGGGGGKKKEKAAGKGKKKA